MHHRTLKATRNPSELCEIAGCVTWVARIRGP
jgi:hypothetical protein